MRQTPKKNLINIEATTVSTSVNSQDTDDIPKKNDKVVKREKLLEGMGRVRHVRQGPDGYIYAALEGVGIIKIVPNK